MDYYLNFIIIIIINIAIILKQTFKILKGHNNFCIIIQNIIEESNNFQNKSSNIQKPIYTHTHTKEKFLTDDVTYKESK